MRPLVMAVCLFALACGSKSGQGPLPMCMRADAVVDGGVGACKSARSVQVCVRPDGRGCVCVSDKASCAGCGPETGATCQNACAPSEYGASCGAGGGGDNPDGSVVIVFDDPPPGCLLVSRGIGLPSTYCCPCL